MLVVSKNTMLRPVNRSRRRSNSISSMRSLTQRGAKGVAKACSGTRRPVTARGEKPMQNRDENGPRHRSESNSFLSRYPTFAVGGQHRSVKRKLGEYKAGIRLSSDGVRRI